ncbi:MAG: hypothetical protein ABSG43_31165, partial [Solirubrobacteraceae bacterium]
MAVKQEQVLTAPMAAAEIKQEPKDEKSPHPIPQFDGMDDDIESEDEQDVQVEEVGPQEPLPPYTPSEAATSSIPLDDTAEIYTLTAFVVRQLIEKIHFKSKDILQAIYQLHGLGMLMRPAYEMNGRRNTHFIIPIRKSPGSTITDYECFRHSGEYDPRKDLAFVFFQKASEHRPKYNWFQRALQWLADLVSPSAAFAPMHDETLAFSMIPEGVYMQWEQNQLAKQTKRRQISRSDKERWRKVSTRCCPNDLSPEDKFWLKPAFRKVFHQLSSVQPNQMVFTYNEICEHISAYILMNKETFFNKKNIHICLVGNDILGQAFKMGAFHRAQITRLLHRQMLPFSIPKSPETMPTVRASASPPKVTSTSLSEVTLSSNTMDMPETENITGLSTFSQLDGLDDLDWDGVDTTFTFPYNKSSRVILIPVQGNVENTIKVQTWTVSSTDDEVNEINLKVAFEVQRALAGETVDIKNFAVAVANLDIQGHKVVIIPRYQEPALTTPELCLTLENSPDQPPLDLSNMINETEDLLQVDGSNDIRIIPIRNGDAITVKLSDVIRLEVGNKSKNWMKVTMVTTATTKRQANRINELVSHIYSEFMTGVPLEHPSLETAQSELTNTGHEVVLKFSDNIDKPPEGPPKETYRFNKGRGLPEALVLIAATLVRVPRPDKDQAKTSGPGGKPSGRPNGAKPSPSDKVSQVDGNADEDIPVDEISPPPPFTVSSDTYKFQIDHTDYSAESITWTETNSKADAESINRKFSFLMRRYMMGVSATDVVQMAAQQALKDVGYKIIVNLKHDGNIDIPPAAEMFRREDGHSVPFAVPAAFSESVQPLIATTTASATMAEVPKSRCPVDHLPKALISFEVNYEGPKPSIAPTKVLQVDGNVDEEVLGEDVRVPPPFDTPSPTRIFTDVPAPYESLEITTRTSNNATDVAVNITNIVAFILKRGLLGYSPNDEFIAKASNALNNISYKTVVSISHNVNPESFQS